MILLTLGNPKLQKSTKFGYLSAILHLSPYKTSGYNVCPYSSATCRSVCLNYSGRGKCSNIQNVRKAKTVLFFTNRKLFFKLLYEDLEDLIKQANRMNLYPTCRLNGTSDVRWDLIKPSLYNTFSTVQFVEYTKSPYLMKRFLEGKTPKNLHVTFSRNELNERQCLKFLKIGGNVAIVFRKKPKKWYNFNVVNGDVHDLCFLHRRGIVLGLKPKGRARYDKLGFVT